jgi:hypothetical protein
VFEPLTEGGIMPVVSTVTRESNLSRRHMSVRRETAHIEKRELI